MGQGNATEATAFTFREMDGASARQIVGWRYDPPYDVYNCEPEDAEAGIEGLLNPHFCYHTVWDGEGKLVGYLGFGEDGRVPGGDYAADALDLGGGLRPDRTGHGLGAAFLAAACEFAGRRVQAVALRVTVAAFNRRALRVCERVGFHPVQTFAHAHSRQPFVVLVREP